MNRNLQARPAPKRREDRRRVPRDRASEVARIASGSPFSSSKNNGSFTIAVSLPVDFIWSHGLVRR